MDLSTSSTADCNVSRNNLFVLASLLSPDVTFAAKGYFDALVRMGELASESQGSKDLGK